MTDGVRASVPEARDQAKHSLARRTELGHAIADRVRILQRLSNDDVPSAVRALALLRRAVGTAPGSDPNVWNETIGLVPDDCLGEGDAPNAAELAAHHAMTLFALHRQGRSEKAHEDGVAPGRAFARVARLRGSGEGDSEGVRRRFDAMITASSPTESAHHLRGLVMLLRSEGVPIDYGLLAEDLADLWSVRGQNRARLRWARQYRGLGEAGTYVAGDSSPNVTTNRTAEE